MKKKKEKKFSWYVSKELHCDSYFDSIEEAILDAKNDSNKPKVISLCECKILSIEEAVEGAMIGIDNANFEFAFNSEICKECIIDQEDVFKKSLAKLIEKHYSFNPVWVATKMLDFYNLAQGKRYKRKVKQLEYPDFSWNDTINELTK